MTIKKALDADSELLVECINNKIQLIKPNKNSPSSTAIPLVNLYNLSMPIFFYDFENKIAGGNTATAEWAALASIQDIQNRPIKSFLGKELSESISRSNKTVCEKQSLQTVFLSGKRKDKELVSAISFKFPCYADDKLIGIFNCSLKTDAQSLPDFLNNTVKLFSTGLIDVSQTRFPSLSPREQTVLEQILQGGTSKEIGERLNISARTVECYMASLKLKTKTKNKSELIEKFKGDL